MSKQKLLETVSKYRFGQQPVKLWMGDGLKDSDFMSDIEHSKLGQISHFNHSKINI